MVQSFARTARERIRIEGGGYRRDHLRALAQRVEVTEGEVRIIGSKSNLIQTLTAAAGVKPATLGVRSSILKWRRECPFFRLYKPLIDLAYFFLFVLQAHEKAYVFLLACSQECRYYLASKHG